MALAAGALIGVLLTVGALVAYDTRTATSVAVGAGIALANLAVLRSLVRSVVGAPEDDEGRAEGEGPGLASGLWGLLSAVKILLLFGGVWVLLTRGLIDPIPLVVGYGVLPLGIVAAALTGRDVPPSNPPNPKPHR